MTTWDATVDFVIAGSGGGGMVAALAGHDAGADVLVLEKQALIGGSTCMSGGIFWIPDNPLMRAEGIPDSYEDALAHFEAVVGDVGPCSSPARRHAFLTAGPEMTTFLQRLGVRLVTAPGTATTTPTPRAATTSAAGSSRDRGTASGSGPGWPSSSPASPRASGWR